MRKGVQWTVRSIYPQRRADNAAWTSDHDEVIKAAPFWVDQPTVEFQA